MGPGLESMNRPGFLVIEAMTGVCGGHVRAGSSGGSGQVAVIVLLRTTGPGGPASERAGSG